MIRSLGPGRRPWRHLQRRVLSTTHVVQTDKKADVQRPLPPLRARPLNNTLNSILDNGFKSIENYLLDTLPTPPETVTENVPFEAEFEDEMRNCDITAVPKLLLAQARECISPSWALNLRRQLWLTSFQHLTQELRSKGRLSQRQILNFILRTTPHVQAKLAAKKDTDYRTNAELKWSSKSCLRLVEICIKLGYFKTAAYAIANAHDVDFDAALQLAPTPASRLLLAMDVYKYEGNTQRILDSSLASNDALLGRFKYCYFLYMRDYKKSEALDADELFWVRAAGKNDDAVRLVCALRRVDLLKAASASSGQYKHFINTHLTDMSAADVAIVMSHMFNFSEAELRGGNVDEAQRRILRAHVLEHVISLKRWPLNDAMARFLIMSLPSCYASTTVADYVWTTRGKALLQLDDCKPVEAFLFERLLDNVSQAYYDEIVSVHFDSLLQHRKYALFRNAIHDFLNTRDDTRLVGVLLSLTNETDYVKLLKVNIEEIFTGPDARSLDDLLRLLSLVSKRSPLTKLKDRCFAYGNEAIREHIHVCIEKSNFKALRQPYAKLLDFLLTHKKQGPHVWRLAPSLFKLATLMPNSVRKANNHPRLEQIFNLTIDYICFAPRLLYILNPRGYPSKVYIQSQTLLHDIAKVLFVGANPQLVNMLIKSRVAWLCADKQDWVSKFRRNMFKFGIFLEVFVRHGIRAKYQMSGTSYFQRQLVDREMVRASRDSSVWKMLECVDGHGWAALSTVPEVPLTEPLGTGIIKVLKMLEARTKSHQSDTSPTYTQDPLEEENEEDILGQGPLVAEPVNLRQDAATFGEVYKVLQHFKDRNANARAATEFDDEELAEIEHDREDEITVAKGMKRTYTTKHKRAMVEMFSPVRLRCKMLEAAMYEVPQDVDRVIRVVFEDYEQEPPVGLIHSIMIGVIRSPHMAFRDKINVVKMLDRASAMVYEGTHTQVFKLHVRFTQVKVELVELVVREAARINGGSLRTLNWAMKKIINMENLGKYGAHLAAWNERLTNMRETRRGFWAPNFKDWD